MESVFPSLSMALRRAGWRDDETPLFFFHAIPSAWLLAAFVHAHCLSGAIYFPESRSCAGVNPRSAIHLPQSYENCRGNYPSGPLQGYSFIIIYFPFVGSEKVPPLFFCNQKAEDKKNFPFSARPKQKHLSLCPQKRLHITKTILKNQSLCSRTGCSCAFFVGPSFGRFFLVCWRLRSAFRCAEGRGEVRREGEGEVWSH